MRGVRCLIQRIYPIRYKYTEFGIDKYSQLIYNDHVSKQCMHISGGVFNELRTNLQLCRRPRHHARIRSGGSPRRNDELPRLRHERDGDVPPLQDVPADRRRGRGRPARAHGHPRQLQGPVHPGRRHAPVLHDSHESDEERQGRLHRDRHLVQEGHCRGEKGRRGHRRRFVRRQELHLYPRLLRSMSSSPTRAPCSSPVPATCPTTA